MRTSDKIIRTAKFTVSVGVLSVVFVPLALLAVLIVLAIVVGALRDGLIGIGALIAAVAYAVYCDRRKQATHRAQCLAARPPTTEPTHVTEMRERILRERELEDATAHQGND